MLRASAAKGESDFVRRKLGKSRRRSSLPAIGRGVGPAKGGAVRPAGGRPLRRGQRADQEHSRQRSRCGALLAGADARRGRGRAVPRPAAGDPGQRGHRQRRSGGLPLAVAAAHACELVGLPECQLTLAQAVTYLALRRSRTRRRSASAKRGPTCARAVCCPCRSICATPIMPAQSGWGTAKATSMPTTARRHRRAGLSRRRAGILPSDRSRLRAGIGRAPGGDSQAAAGKRVGSPPFSTSCATAWNKHAGRKSLPRHCLFQAVAHFAEKSGLKPVFDVVLIVAPGWRVAARANTRHSYSAVGGPRPLFSPVASALVAGYRLKGHCSIEI